MSVFKDFPGLENLEKNSRTFKDPQEPCNTEKDLSQPPPLTSFTTMTLAFGGLAQGLCYSKQRGRATN